MENDIKVLSKINCLKEQNGYYEINSPYGQQITNEQGKYIVEKININQDIETICTSLSQSYKLDKKTAEEYVYDFLSELKNLEIIDFDETYFSELVKKEEINVAGEREYIKLVKATRTNLENDKNNIFSISNDSKYFNEYSVRTKSFHHIENYFFEYDDDKKSIKNIIGIQNMNKVDIPISICLIQHAGDYKSLLSFYFKVEKKMMQMKKYKIKIIFNEENVTEKLLEFLKETGIELEAKLIKEDGQHNQLIYSKLLEDVTI